MPRRVLTLLEGESLFNDAAALTALGVAVGAVVTGSFGVLDATGQFLLISLGGLAVGAVVALVLARVRARIKSPLSDVTLSLLAPFGAYLSAEAIHGSGLVAVVVVGLYLGHRSPTLMDPDARVISGSVWRVIQYLLEGAVFVLMGLQLPDIVAGLEGESPAVLAGAAAAVLATLIVARFVWMFPGAYLPGLLSRRIREREGLPPWQDVVVVSWAGMRGVVSLAAAFALPLTLQDGSPFPQRDLLLFLTFAVIVVTLLLPGLTLPAVVRGLRLSGSDPAEDARQEAEARRCAATAALQRLDELSGDGIARPEVVDQLRSRAEHRQLDAEEQLDDRAAEPGRRESPAQTYRRLAQAMLAAEREQFVQLRDAGQLNDEVFRRLQRELDLEESTLLRD